MKFPRLFEKVFCQPWAIQPAAHSAVRSVLLQRMNGASSPVKVGMVDDDTAPADEEAWTPYFKAGNRGEIAVIEIDGYIGSHLSMIEQFCGGCDVAALRMAVDQAEADASIERILFSFNSPGGTITGVPELAARIKASGKPTVAFTDSLCASAAYWLASQCDEIWVTPSSDTGSIGVYLALLDETAAMQMEGLKLELFQAGEHKAIGMPGRPLTQSDREMLQASVDKSYGWFTSAVTSARPGVTPETMQGQTFDGDDAVARGLADGTVDSLNSLLNALAGLTSEKTQ
ncbi:MAG: hypothetical protein B9S32_13900 [Verrucomicrobia bacterium Tous-C9LFEB]|nr:MAG: hypothetical protein B9S32_13900 [Verrucomicrobia bacterium Tous-C9LFEB]